MSDPSKFESPDERDAWTSLLLAASAICSARASMAVFVGGSQTDPREEVTSAEVAREADALLKEQRARSSNSEPYPDAVLLEKAASWLLGNQLPETYARYLANLLWRTQHGVE